MKKTFKLKKPVEKEKVEGSKPMVFNLDIKYFFKVFAVCIAILMTCWMNTKIYVSDEKCYFLTFGKTFEVEYQKIDGDGKIIIQDNVSKIVIKK